nr:AAA family ATPase [Gloiopeltis furcata]
MSFEDELKLLFSSRYLLIYIVTSEEERLEHVINKIALNESIDAVYSWDFLEGYHCNPNYSEQAKKNPLAALELIESLNSKTSNVFILKDFHLFMHDTSIILKLKNLARRLKDSGSSIIMIAPNIKIPDLLNNIITVLDFPLPNLEEISEELRRLLSVTRISTQIKISDLSFACKGMSIESIRRSIAKLISSGRPVMDVFHIITREKEQIVRQTNILDLYPVNMTLDEIGGLSNLKHWLKKRSNSFSLHAQSYGIPTPRGILLVGIQGTGKSLSAKVISQEWNLPLFRLDVGKIFGGLIGESEGKMRTIIKVSEDCSPCVLWIDEIDKAFNHNNSGDSGTASRVLSTFLIWLSEKTTQVFIVATANNILNLPPEMLRKGRFDEIFFLDLPNLHERYKIFQVHLMKIRPLTWQQYDINYLSQLTGSFSGAEIEQSIVESMHNAFYEKRDFTTCDIVHAVKEIIPLAFTDSSTISSLQDWASLGKVRLASN